MWPYRYLCGSIKVDSSPLMGEGKGGGGLGLRNELQHIAKILRGMGSNKKTLFVSPSPNPSHQGRGRVAASGEGFQRYIKTGEIFSFDWAGGLKEYKDKFTSPELQKKL